MDEKAKKSRLTSVRVAYIGIALFVIGLVCALSGANLGGLAGLLVPVGFFMGIFGLGIEAVTRSKRDEKALVTPLRAMISGTVLVVLGIVAYFGVDDSCRGTEVCGDDFSALDTYWLTFVLVPLGLIVAIWGLATGSVTAGIRGARQQTEPTESMPGRDKIAQLNELARLKDSGTVTDDEFQELKREILD